MVLETIKKRKDFVTVYGRGKYYKTPIFTLYCFKNSGHDITRFGFTASKKTGKAVQRNKIKRRLKGMIREIGQNEFAKSTDYIIVAKTDALKCKFDIMKENLNLAKNKLHKKLCINF